MSIFRKGSAFFKTIKHEELSVVSSRKLFLQSCKLQIESEGLNVISNDALSNGKHNDSCKPL